MKSKISAVLFVIFTVFGSVLSASAASSNQRPITFSGITVTPAVSRINLVPGQDQLEYKISVINNSTEDVTLDARAVDFKSLNDSGGIAFITSDKQQLDSKYGLTKWLEITPNSFNIKKNKSQTIDVKVKNSQELSPGGHYAAILFQNQNETSNRGETHVDVNQVVSSLIFIQKLGGEKYDLSLRPLQISTAWLNLPSTAKLFFKNTGNIQSAPYGTVKIINATGGEVARGQINPDSSLVLPDSTRYFRTDLIKTSRAILPGTYKMQVKYHPDGSKETKFYEQKFTYVNIPFLLLMIFILASICYLSYKTYIKRHKT